MADGYWSGQRQQQQQHQQQQHHQQQQQQLHSSSSLLKRHRADYDLPPSGLPFSHNMHNHLPQNNDIGGPNSAKNADTTVSAYERYLQSAKLPSGEASGYGVGMHSIPLTANGQPFAVDPHSRVDMMARAPRETLPLPADASSTIYIEGLPSDCTRREVAHVFRPFVGYKEVRLISKESKHRGGDPLILGFVDFSTPACAATALSALQGYPMDEHDPNSSSLRLQFSKHPGPRSGPARRGGRR